MHAQEGEGKADIFPTTKTSHSVSAKSTAIQRMTHVVHGISPSNPAMTESTHGKGISAFGTLQRQKSATRGSTKSQSASQTKESSKLKHVERVSHTKKNTAGDGDTDDPDDASGEEAGNCDDSRSDRRRRPDTEKEAKDTDRSVTEITPSREAWEKVTGHKQKPRAEKSKQLATARGFRKIRDPETYNSKSHK